MDVNFFRDLVTPVLQSNPHIRNSALAGVVAANIVGFKGHVRVFDDKGPSGKLKAIHISPYGFWQDLLVSIKRIFTGVVFPARTGDLRSDLAQGRRITIFVSANGNTPERVEGSQKPRIVGLVKRIFSCC